MYSPASGNQSYSSNANCESEVLTILMKVQAVMLVVFGFLANLFSFIVLIQPRLRRRPTFSYLAFLSLSNAFLSLTHAFFTIIGVYFGLTLQNLSLFFFCRLLNRFVIDFLTHFSLYTLTAVDLDRIRTVTSKTADDRRYNQQSTGGANGCAQAFIRVCLIELSFGCILFFLDLHWLTSYGYTIEVMTMNGELKHETMCIVVDNDVYSISYGRYLTSILPIVEVVLFGVLPFLISLLATIVILRHVSLKLNVANPANKHLQQSRRRMELHLSILLISLNCVFILFTTPHNVYNVYVAQLHRKLSNKPDSEGELCPISITQKCLDLLQQCYFMSTFFLYILTNKRFREESCRLLKCYVCIFHQKKTKKSNSESHLQTYRNRTINNHSHWNKTCLEAPLHPREVDRCSISEDLQDDEHSVTLNN